MGTSMTRVAPWLLLFVVSWLLLSVIMASAQIIGGNASLSVTTTTGSVALPASTATYSSLLISQPAGSTQEVFFALGGSTVVATTGSPSLPPGGVCLNVGPNTYLAAITAQAVATLRLTQLSVCPLR